MYAGSDSSPPGPHLAPKNSRSAGLSHPLMSSNNIDISHLEKVTCFNDFKLDNHVNLSSPDIEGPGSGLYNLASFGNHSCLHSARRANFGDFLVVRAARPIKKGEEITLEYTDGSAPLKTREKLSNWGFTCCCKLCKADEADGAKARSLREQLLEEILPYETSPEAAEQKLSEIKRSYKDTPERRACCTKPTLSKAYHQYALTLIAHSNKGAQMHVQAIEAEMDCLEAIGMKVVDRSVSGPLTGQGLPVDPTRGPTHKPGLYTMIVLQVVSTFVALGDNDRAKNWMKVASWSELTFI